jgi:Transcriptional regulator of a riboflavin/FAD biosynthetic operon
MKIKGIVVSGTKKGAYFMSQSIYRDQFEDKLHFRPFIGTLNVHIEDNDTKKVEKLLESDISQIKGEKTFGDVKFKKATLNNEIEGAVIFPEKTRHSTDVVEFIAPQNLKERFHISDGNSVTINIPD